MNRFCQCQVNIPFKFSLSICIPLKMFIINQLLPHKTLEPETFYFKNKSKSVPCQWPWLSTDYRTNLECHWMATESLYSLAPLFSPLGNLQLLSSLSYVPLGLYETLNSKLPR
jgi:hypothetical protein